MVISGPVVQVVEVDEAFFDLGDSLFQTARQRVPLPEPLLKLCGIHSEEDGG